MSSDAAPAGAGIYPLYKPNPDHAGVRAHRTGADPVRHGFGLSAQAVAARTAFEPPYFDDADHAQASGVIDVRHRRRTGLACPETGTGNSRRQEPTRKARSRNR